MKLIKSKKYILGLGLVALPIFFLPYKQLAYQVFLHTSIYEHTVPLIPPQEVSLKQDIILDIRSPKEFGVSHLPYAQFVDYDSFDVSKLPSIEKDKKIVVYCSVGYRSERIGEKLQEAGYTNVHNLEGGIFQWVNQELEVVDSAGSTQNIHPFSKDWGFWLRNGNQVME
ncbi:rhodanese-like domain-containing protein [Flammeovirgaceae bacterium SG7u.111]|nr:rhodanese-like domain-containing protein [Flammeovirgaceae bacterium SG7u.132]WPO33834.1 rhodanese-like domain-containing protein [Flammeovirgaceae bacterium SG7u.111]